MAKKSIISVDIDDTKWRAFNAEFKKHTAEVKKMPGQWGKIGSTIQKGTDAVAKFLAQIKATGLAMNKAHTFAGKMVLSLKASDRVVSSIARGTLSVARNLKDATISLLKWGTLTGLFSGLLGAGGLFGITRLAQSVSAGQTSAMRTGGSYGGTQAAGISYGQILGGQGGVDRLADQIFASQVSGGLMLKRLGAFGGLKPEDWQGKSPSDVIGPLLQALKTAYNKMPAATRGLSMQAYAPEGMDLGTLEQISKSNIGALTSGYNAKQKELNLSQGTQQAWANFDRQMQTVGQRMENAFIVAISPLLPSLTKFSNALINAIGIVLGSKQTKAFIGWTSKELTGAAHYLASPQFETDLKSFLVELGKIGVAMEDTAAFLHKWLGSPDEPRYKPGTPEYRRMMMEERGDTKPSVMDGFSGFTPGSPPAGKVILDNRLTIVHTTPSGDNPPMQAQMAIGIPR